MLAKSEGRKQMINNSRVDENVFAKTNNCDFFKKAVNTI